MKNLEDIKKKYQEIKLKLQEAERVLDWKESGRLKRDKETFEKIVKKDEKIKDTQKQLQETENLLNKEKETNILILAKEEKEKLEKILQKEKKELKQLLQEINKEKQVNELIMEIRAGAGGDEAALFAADLFNMYSKYAQNIDWQIRVLNTNSIGIGGYKEIIFSIQGEDCFNRLKNEAGVHRVQRIPETEKSGRIHTSTASVAVLPKPKKSQEINIKTEDLQIDTFKASGPGGQNVNKRETAIRITHLPTGVIVSSQTERNQAQNKENALSILQAKLLESKNEKQTEALENKRRDQIKQAKRSEKIRTYNFAQNRISDHRIKKTWYNLDQVMVGQLEEIINECQKLNQ
jgi:peptide chain release factor 1